MPALMTCRVRGTLERVQATADEQPVPQAPLLVEQQDRLTGRPGPGAGTGCLDLHQGGEAMHLGDADHAVIGDLREVIPALVAAIHARAAAP